MLIWIGEQYVEDPREVHAGWQALGVTAWHNANMEAEKKHNEGLYGPIRYYILRAQLLPGKTSEAARSA